MTPLATLLSKKLHNARRVSVLGVGSTLRGDDAAGMLIAHEIDAYRKKEKKGKVLQVLFGETAPENFTGDIRKFNPTHLIIIDCAEVKKKPGSVFLLDVENITGITFSTHSLPLKIMTDYLLKDMTCEIIIIGIQPKALLFNTPCSAQIKKSVKDVSVALKEVLNKIL